MRYRSDGFQLLVDQALNLLTRMFKQLGGSKISVLDPTILCHSIID